MVSLEIARDYVRAGLCVLPARLTEKRPDLRGWKEYQSRLPTDQELQDWFASERPVCVLTGAVSGNLEMLDFDCGGELYDRWAELVREHLPDLLDRLLIEQSQSGGRHVVYRCSEPISGNLKLAQRVVAAPNGDEVTIGGKRFRPRHVGDHYEVTLTLIETRSEGGLFLCHPSPGYTLSQGSFTNLPVLSATEREILLEAAWSLNEYLAAPAPANSASEAGGRPGDDFNERGDVREVLIKHGWSLARPGENEYWRRPGKDIGWSATLKDRVFYVFSANAAPFEQNRAYSPFSVYALLEHDGDFARAAAALRPLGFGSNVAEVVSFDPVTVPDEALASDGDLVDPGPTPEHLLHVPGFVDQVMTHTLETAPYPERTLAFCGALALQSVLAARKARDAADNRTNLYILALANSGAGKDYPRKLNQRILLEAGMAECLGNSFASGEGIEDRLFVHPAALFQVDEVDGLLLRVGQAKDARHEQMVSVLLQMYSSANGVYVMRAKAGAERTVIDQPCLSIFGTAVPKHFYESITPRLMTNGFLARMLILESQRRGQGREAVVQPIPGGILSVARWWAEFQPSDRPGNLNTWHPAPRLVEHTSDAGEALRAFRQRADGEYTRVEDKNDPVAMAIWARAYEKARRLALIYACSNNHQEPVIERPAVDWACAFVEHQTRRMLFMARFHASESDFDAKRKRLIEVMSKWRAKQGDQWMPFWMINRKLPWSNREHEQIRDTLVAQRLIEIKVNKGGGRPGMMYRLVMA